MSSFGHTDRITLVQKLNQWVGFSTSVLKFYYELRSPWGNNIHKTIDYTDLREYYVFTKRPIQITLKTDVLSTWRTWTSKQNTWPPFDPIQSPRQQLIKNDRDRDLKWFLWRTLWVSTFRNSSLALALQNLQLQHLTYKISLASVIVCEFLKKSSFEIYVLQNIPYD